ncbi:MAG: hypothetical protein V1846_02115 [Candidatus Komeilibacteria bacterium]
MIPSNQWIRDLMQNKVRLIEIANACAAAYNEGCGHPEWTEPFGEDKPEMVAQNLAGPQAVLTGCSIMALTRGVEPDYLPLLRDIVNGDVTETERGILHRAANGTWGAGQSFRTDKGPLGRMTRMNLFDDLDPVEVAKDWAQIQAAAAYLLQHAS